MSLEAMKKDDLVKHARSLEQKVKMIEIELEDLKAIKKANETEDDSLPLTAISLVKVSKYRSIVVKIDFNLDGKCKVTKLTSPQEHYRTEHDMDRLVTKEVLTVGKYYPEIVKEIV